MDLREMGSPFEKKFTKLTKDDIAKVANTYHTWQTTDFETAYENTPEYCYAATLSEIQKKDYSLVPSPNISNLSIGMRI
jgi:type I restriction enzyme M protein